MVLLWSLSSWTKYGEFSLINPFVKDRISQCSSISLGRLPVLECTPLLLMLHYSSLLLGDFETRNFTPQIYKGTRSCVRVYKISHMRESVRQISKWERERERILFMNSDTINNNSLLTSSKYLQGRVWSGKHFNSYSRLGPGPAFGLIIKYYLVS